MPIISLKFGSQCQKCRTRLEKGSKAVWQPQKGVTCVFCPPKQQNAFKPALRPNKTIPKMTLDGFSEARRAFYQETPDFTWTRCAKGQLLETLQNTGPGLF